MKIETDSSGILGPAWLESAAPLPVFAALATPLILIWFSALVEVSYESRWTTMLLNTLLVTGVSAWGAWLAVRGYLASGLPELLYAGGGLAAMGSSFFVASLIIGDSRGPNAAVTVHNLGVFCAAWLHLAAALHAGHPRARLSDPSAIKAVCIFLGVLTLTGIFWAAAQLDLAPAFYIAAEGSTPVRQLILMLSIALLAIAAAFLIRHTMQRRSLSLRCYGLGLGLIAMGLVDVSIAVPGSVLSWAGRISQSLGHIYLLAAFLIAIRMAVRRGINVKEAAADFYLDSEGHYRALVNALRAAVISLDPKGRVVLWNRQAEAIFGYSYAEAAGNPLADLVAPERGGREAFRTVLEDGPERYLEVTLRRKDGSEFSAEALAVPAGPGWTKWANLIIRDISDRRQAEYELQKKELRIRQALRVSRSFAFEWNPATDEVTRSEECGPLLGLHGNEALRDSGRNYFQRVHPEDRELFAALLETLTPERPSYATKYRLVRPDGETVILEETGLGFFDPERHMSLLTGISTDVTLREKAQAEIAYLATFPRLNPNPIIEADTDGTVRFSNPTAAELFPDLQQHGRDHPWLGDWSAVSESLRDGRQSRIAREVDIAGRCYYQTLHFVPESRTVRIYGVDITGLKAAEDALRNSEARFRLLADTASQLLATRNPPGHIGELAARVMAHLDCHCFFNFLVVEEQPGRLRLNAWAGIPAEETRRIEWLEYDAAVCGILVRDGRRMLAERIPTVPDVRIELVQSYGIKAYTCHPLVGVDGRLLGTLSFGTRSRETFTGEDLELMNAVADQVAVALVRMRYEKDLQASSKALHQANLALEEEVRKRTHELVKTVASLKNEILVRKKAQAELQQISRKSLEALEAERRTIARELHDSIGGSLAAIKFGLEGVAEQTQGEPLCEPGQLQTLISQLAETIKETKRIAANLRPLSIDDLGLLSTIEWSVRQFCQRYQNIRVVSQINVEEPNIPEEYKIVFYRVMQEALNNAAKHSRADTVYIRLNKTASHFEFEVEDNGAGFEPDELFSRRERLSGFGLKSMRERTEICGGVFTLETRPERGTSVRIALPVPESDPPS